MGIRLMYNWPTTSRLDLGTSFAAAGALVHAIKVLGLSKVSFSSPYLEEINTKAVAFLSQNQITTVKCTNIGRELGNYGQGELTPDEVFDLACEADHPEAEAIVLSCTDCARSKSLIGSRPCWTNPC